MEQNPYRLIQELDYELLKKLLGLALSMYPSEFDGCRIELDCIRSIRQSLIRIDREDLEILIKLAKINE